QENLYIGEQGVIHAARAEVANHGAQLADLRLNLLLFFCGRLIRLRARPKTRPRKHLACSTLFGRLDLDRLPECDTNAGNYKGQYECFQGRSSTVRPILSDSLTPRSSATVEAPFDAEMLRRREINFPVSLRRMMSSFRGEISLEIHLHHEL